MTPLDDELQGLSVKVFTGSLYPKISLENIQILRNFAPVNAALFL
ncbi:MAG: hypothetical protein R6U64_10745 [Bacteroidales bacterium]